jgi:hypothetical protein
MNNHKLKWKVLLKPGQSVSKKLTDNCRVNRKTYRKLASSTAEVSHDLHYEFGVLEKSLQDAREIIVDAERRVRLFRQKLEVYQTDLAGNKNRTGTKREIGKT